MSDFDSLINAGDRALAAAAERARRINHVTENTTFSDYETAMLGYQAAHQCMLNALMCAIMALATETHKFHIGA